MTKTPGKDWKIAAIVGARPNFMKIAPLANAFANTAVDFKIIHTGQHYDPALSTTFFEQLRIPAPDRHLGVGSGSHAAQTAEVMRQFEPILDEEKPDAVLVVGDVNSTLACALVAAKKLVPVVHVEAGLRSEDRTMPEEINRILTDQISDVLYVTERTAIENLKREGVPHACIEFAGNVMVDTLLDNLKSATPPQKTLRDVSKVDFDKGYALLTLHRPSNVDSRAALEPLLETICEIATKITIIFPVHPRTKNRIVEFGLEPLLEKSGIITMPPANYLQMAGLMAHARFVLTDSGGVQEETTALGVPCLTLRSNTERPITVTEGTNTIVGTDRQTIRAAADNIIANGGKRGRVPELWDGKAATRIAKDLQRRLSEGRMRRPTCIPKL